MSEAGRRALRAAVTGSLLAVWAVAAAVGAIEVLAAASGSGLSTELLRFSALCAGVAAIAGAPVGAVAPRLRGGAGRRLAAIAAAIGLSYVAANLAVALVAAIGAGVIEGTARHAASAALVVLYGAGILVGPVLAVPLLLAAAALEVMTRPGEVSRARRRATTALKLAMALVGAAAVALAMRHLRR